MANNYYPAPDFAVGRDAPTDDMQIGLSRAFREMSREDSSEYFGSQPDQLGITDLYGQWHGQDFGGFVTMQDFLRPGKAAINPPYRGQQGGR